MFSYLGLLTYLLTYHRTACRVDCVESGSYQYLGCHKDQEGIGRDLNGRDLMLTGLTADVCAAQCQPIGYPYFGLQLGTRCFCGDNYGSHGASIGWLPNVVA